MSNVRCELREIGVYGRGMRAQTFLAAMSIGLAMVSSGTTSAQDRSPAGLYAAQCSSCHGPDLMGGGASALADGRWEYGSDRQRIARWIKFGIEDMGMPAYGPAMSDREIDSLVTYILEVESEQVGRNRAPAQTATSRQYRMRIETVADALEIPWAIDWLPSGEALITERPGRLRRLVNGKLLPDPVAATPEVLHRGQGGLMEVAIDPDYSNNGWIYLAYTHRIGASNNAMTRLVRGKIQNNRWTDEQLLWQAKPDHYLNSGVHYGCRITFDKDGFLFFSLGERGRQDMAQDLTRPNGKIHRIRPDGSIPRDNPFVGQPGVYESIWSFGHRNPQGLIVHPQTGLIWSTEHGPMGGDELNWVRKGLNYGWPLITYGRNYNGTEVSKLTEKDGLEQPAHQWTPSPALCGLDVMRGDLFPAWNGHLLVGALAFQEVKRVEVDDKGRVLGQEVILKNQGRVRDVAVGPEGAIYVVLNGPDKVIKLVPEK